jgi:hypothetical protein
MRSYLVILLLLSGACKPKPQQDFVIVTTGDDEWVHYEGEWIIPSGTVYLELALKTGAQGLDAQYKLYESVVTDSMASGTSSDGVYTTFMGRRDSTMGIVLRNLSDFTYSTFFRYRESADLPEEMFFITRGQYELLPCDPDFKPLTTDKRYTLHRRSELQTVEGYVTFDADSVDFFECNTRVRYSMADLAEFHRIKKGYKILAKEKHAGVYVKALAYTVVDSTGRNNRALVIKRLLMMGDETDEELVSQIGVEADHEVMVKKKD